MVAYAKQPYTTPEEYLHWERKSDKKHEYLEGVVVAMAGATKEHTRITFDLSQHIGQQISGTTCEAFGNDMRVGIPKSNRYYYPDVTIVCGEAQFEDNIFDTLLNPKVIMEVLSESTSSKDRGEKFHHYQNIESLNKYVLISSDKPMVEIYHRQENFWHYTITEGTDAELILEEMGIIIPLSKIYARVPFETQDI